MVDGADEHKMTSRYSHSPGFRADLQQLSEGSEEDTSLNVTSAQGNTDE